jgi:hypothetical protein
VAAPDEVPNAQCASLRRSVIVYEDRKREAASLAARDRCVHDGVGARQRFLAFGYRDSVEIPTAERDLVASQRERISSRPRIQLGQLGRLPHAFLDSICEQPKANDTEGGRLVEKLLTRVKHSILFDVYDLDGACALADEQKALALRSTL